jgi:pseudouridine kinase
MLEGISFSPDAPALVIGGAGIDIVGRLKSELRTDTSNQAHIRYTFGGAARNIAENLARLGQHVSLITAIGEDEDADRMLLGLTKAGVNVGAVMRTSQFNTGTYLAVINPAGRLEFALDDMRIVSCLTPEYLRQFSDLFLEASFLVLDTNLPKESLRAAMSLAKRARLPVCADPTAASLAHRLKPYLSRMYLITPNSHEASILCDPPRTITNRRQALEGAKCLVSQGVQIAIITLAEHGLVYATTETSGYIPAIRTEVLDPTGAGDALTATVIFALLNGIELDEAVRLGVSAASLTLRYGGAVVPDLSLEKLYDHLVF